MSVIQPLTSWRTHRIQHGSGKSPCKPIGNGIMGLILVLHKGITRQLIPKNCLEHPSKLIINPHKHIIIHYYVHLSKMQYNGRWWPYLAKWNELTDDEAVTWRTRELYFGLILLLFWHPSINYVPLFPAYKLINQLLLFIWVLDKSLCCWQSRSLQKQLLAYFVVKCWPSVNGLIFL